MHNQRMASRPIGVLMLILALASSSPAPAQTSRRSQRVRMDQVQVASPSGKVRLTLLPNAERLTFTVTLDQTPVLDPSTIVMQVDGYDLSAGVVLGQIETYEIDERYPWYGAHSTAVNRCRGARVSLRHDLSFIDYVLEIRAFDDGVAFRHIIPGATEVSRTADEYTTFVIPAGSTVWHHDLGGHYEAAYDQDDVSDVRPGEWAGPPLTFKLPGHAGYGSITEANLVNYSGMALEADGRRGWVTGLGHRQPLNYPYELRYGRDEAKRLAQPASITGSITTPWRVILAAANLNTLVNSTLVPNLCPPPDPRYFPQGLGTPWIKPGRAVWRYLDGGDRSLEGMKAFSRWAGQLGFEYHVIEGFWSQWSDAQIVELVAYSRQQGVGLWFWRHTNQVRTPEAQEAFFKRLHDLGVGGAKLDFFSTTRPRRSSTFTKVCCGPPQSTRSWSTSMAPTSPRVAPARGPTSSRARPSAAWKAAPCGNGPVTRPSCPSRGISPATPITPPAISATAAPTPPGRTRSPAWPSSPVRC